MTRWPESFCQGNLGDGDDKYHEMVAIATVKLKLFYDFLVLG